jgi:hypothetical protein
VQAREQYLRCFRPHGVLRNPVRLAEHVHHTSESQTTRIDRLASAFVGRPEVSEKGLEHDGPSDGRRNDEGVEDGRRRGHDVGISLWIGSAVAFKSRFEVSEGALSDFVLCDCSAIRSARLGLQLREKWGEHLEEGCSRVRSFGDPILRAAVAARYTAEGTDTSTRARRD